MGISILTGEMDGRQRTVLVDNTTNVAFGPLMESPEQAEKFLAWMREAEDWFVHDVRTMPPEKLTNVYRGIFLPAWRRRREGHLL